MKTVYYNYMWIKISEVIQKPIRRILFRRFPGTPIYEISSEYYPAYYSAFERLLFPPKLPPK